MPNTHIYRVYWYEDGALYSGDFTARDLRHAIELAQVQHPDGKDFWGELVA